MIVWKDHCVNFANVNVAKRDIETGGDSSSTAEPPSPSMNPLLSTSKGNSQSSSLNDIPEPLEGWLDKKGGTKSGFSLGPEWQPRFLRVDEPSQSLTYFKSDKKTEKPSGIIDLKLIRDVTPLIVDGREDYSRFNVDCGDKVYKFKAKSKEDGTKWINGLNDWHDYFLMNMTA